MRILPIIVSIFLCIPCTVMAGVSVDLQLDRTESSMADTIRMKISVSGTRDAGEPRIEGLKDFSVSRGGTSSRTSIINGAVSSSIDYIYFLQPKTKGVFVVGPAVVQSGEKSYSSNKVELRIKESAASKGGEKAAIFLTADVSSKSVYIEDQIQYTLKLFHIPEISDVSLIVPEIEGFEFRQTEKPVEYQTVYNDKTYQVVQVRYSVTVSKEGKYSIYPSKMGMSVHEQSRGGEDDIFSGSIFSQIRGSKKTVLSNSIEINVLPVPEKGKPLNYTGLVGRFNITSSLDPSRIKAGESATLTVIVKGKGNLKRMPDLKLPGIENAKIYADNPVLEISEDDTLEGTKTMKWAIVPEKEGVYPIPELSISYFDTGKKAYQQIKSSAHSLTADPGTGQMAVSPFGDARAAKKEAVEELGKDILPIHGDADLADVSGNSPAEWLFWVLMVLPVIIFAFVAGSRKFAGNSPGKEAKSKAGKAGRILLKMLDEGEVTAELLYEGFRTYFNERFHLALGSLTPGDAAEILTSKGCSEETAKGMTLFLKELENAIYTGKGGEPVSSVNDIAAVIKKIEKEIK